MRHRRDGEQDPRVADLPPRPLRVVVRAAADQRHRHQRQLEAAQPERDDREQRHARADQAAPVPPPASASRPGFQFPAHTSAHHALDELRVVGEVRDPTADDEQRQRAGTPRP